MTRLFCSLGFLAAVPVLCCPVWAVEDPLTIAPLLVSSTSAVNPPLTQTPTAIVLLEQGQRDYQEGHLTAALDHWQQARDRAEAEQNLALLVQSYILQAIVQQDLGQWTAAAASLEQATSRVDPAEVSPRRVQLLNTQGSLQFRQGQIENALQSWEQSQSLYQELDDPEGELLSQINQIYALQALGFYYRTGEMLATVHQQILALPPSPTQVNSWRSVAQIFQSLGKTKEAEAALDQALGLATELNLPPALAEIWLQRGNLYGSQAQESEDPELEEEQLAQALDAFTQAVQLSPNPETQLQAQLNQFRLLLQMKRPLEALSLWPTLITEIQGLEPSRFGIVARVNVAESVMRGMERLNLSAPGVTLEWPERQTLRLLLGEAIRQAQQLGDLRLQAYALGQLGHLYEQNQQYDEALRLTEQAVVLAQTVRAEDGVALWQWQKGRILKVQNQIPAAIVAYQTAVDTLQNLRQDLVASPQEVQFSFRESVEPVYRELAALLLDNVAQLSPEDRQARLIQARSTIEALQLAELDNFFRESCLNAKPQSIETIDQRAAVIYPILLADSIEVIVSLPNQPLQHHRVNVANSRRTSVLLGLRQFINPAFSANRVIPLGQQAYDWIIRPIEETLASHNIETIVFVLDGLLRNVPMAVLHDGDRYLVQKYNLALAPGLQLLQTEDQKRNNLNPGQRFANSTTLAGGLSDARNGFAELPNVKVEIEELANLLQAGSVLINESFTGEKLEKQLANQPVSVVHLATHGQFSSKAEETFLLTWDGQINVKSFDQLLTDRPSQMPIELLVLSACQTAQGDSRASLGLAGIAVRSGAKSTLGSLWSINDRSTAELIIDFYQNLLEGQEKAAALRSAQVELLQSADYNHPYYWAPFVLVGQWQ